MEINIYKQTFECKIKVFIIDKCYAVETKNICQQLKNNKLNTGQQTINNFS